MTHGAPRFGVDAAAIDFVMLGEPVFVTEPMTGRRLRARYLVADELSIMAGESSRAGRPDRAGLLNSIQARVRYGRPATKKQLTRARKELQELRDRLTMALPQAVTIYPVGPQ